MSIKTIALAVASVSALAAYSTAASAQATRFYDSPAQARTDDASEARAGQRSERAYGRAYSGQRRIDSFAAAPRGGVWIYQPNVWDKHTSEVKDW